MDYNTMLKKLIIQFTRIVNKYNSIENMPLKIGPEETIYPSEIHIIQIIGEKAGNTVTELYNTLNVTKGAVSQTVTRLEKKGYVIKARNPDFGKEINLSLTEKGWLAFNFHEDLHRKKDDELLRIFSKLPDEQIANIKIIFNFTESYIDSFSK